MGTMTSQGTPAVVDVKLLEGMRSMYQNIESCGEGYWFRYIIRSCTDFPQHSSILFCS